MTWEEGLFGWISLYIWNIDSISKLMQPANDDWDTASKEMSGNEVWLVKCAKTYRDSSLDQISE